MLSLQAYKLILLIIVIIVTRMATFVIIIIIMIFSVSIKSNYPQPRQGPFFAQSTNKTIINNINLLMFPGSLFLSLITAF